MSTAEEACVATEGKIALQAVLIAIVSAVILVGMELFFLYEEFLVYLPVAIVGALRMMVGRL